MTKDVDAIRDFSRSIQSTAGEASGLSTMLEAAFSVGNVHIVVAPVGYSENMRVLVKQTVIREDVKSYS